MNKVGTSKECINLAMSDKLEQTEREYDILNYAAGE